MRGIAGSGKTHLIRQAGLEQYALSFSQINTMYHSPTLDINGKVKLPYLRKNVYQVMLSMAQERFRQGQLVILDDRNIKWSELREIVTCAQRNRYKVYCLTMPTEFDQCVEWNNSRPESMRDSLTHMQKQWDEMATEFNIAKLAPQELATCGHLRTRELTGYFKRVMVIGDVHGAYDALMKLNSFADMETMYIFLGDLLDKGIQNKEVFEFVEQHINQPNFVFLEGNHDTHFANFAKYQPVTNPSFFTQTLPDVFGDNWAKNINVSRSRLDAVAMKLKEYFSFTFNGQHYFCSHGGVAKFKAEHIYSAQELIYGTGGYMDDIGRIYTDNESSVIQFHGHRQASTTHQSYCLTGTAEFGGDLMCAVIDDNGVHVRSVKNERYDVDYTPYSMFYVEERFDDEIKQNVREHKWLVKPMATRGHKRLFRIENPKQEGFHYLFVNEKGERVARTITPMPLVSKEIVLNQMSNEEEHVCCLRRDSAIAHVANFNGEYAIIYNGNLYPVPEIMVKAVKKQFNSLPKEKSNMTLVVQLHHPDVALWGNVNNVHIEMLYAVDVDGNITHLDKKWKRLSQQDFAAGCNKKSKNAWLVRLPDRRYVEVRTPAAQEFFLRQKIVEEFSKNPRRTMMPEKLELRDYQFWNFLFYLNSIGALFSGYRNETVPIHEIDRMYNEFRKNGSNKVKPLFLNN